jgi:D-arabinose 1-dehydrogenase-like Zn-dependent alcohol dehydrogenase
MQVLVPRVGVIGLGGLGHMGVKLAAAMGAEVNESFVNQRVRSKMHTPSGSEAFRAEQRCTAV